MNPSTPPEVISSDSAPTSFGVFKPVGHLMVGLPDQARADALASAVQGMPWGEGAVQQFKPRESVHELEAMVDNAGALAGFGYEITLLRRYLSLSREGTQWLLVRVDDDDQAEAVAAQARAIGATLAVHYGMLTIEDLI